MNIRYTERFLCTAKKLPQAIQNDLIRVVNQIIHPAIRDPLHVYPLDGRFRGLSALSINFAYQAIVISSEDSIIFLDVALRVII